MDFKQSLPPIFRGVFEGPGGARIKWEVASRCSCFTVDTRQPQWDCTICGGDGVMFAAAVEIRALFRGQSRWTSPRASGEHGLGEAQLTTPTTAKPGYTDHLIRDRYTVLEAPGDVVPGRVFYPAAQAVPFLFGGSQHAWRVQLQGLDQETRLRPQT